MMEVPSTAWRAEPWAEAEALEAAPVAAAWRALPGIVRHGFTHFHLELAVLAGEVTGDAPPGTWVAMDRLGDHALPNLMKKVVEHALGTVGRRASRS
jgi:A/G-specific adenine glycosylase